MSLDALFQPFACRSLRLDNRIAMASVARWSAPGGDPTALGPYYRRRIEGGAALVMTEGAPIGRPASYNDPAGPHFFGPALDGWRSVVNEVHGAGGKIIPQLWHCGVVAKAGSDWTPPGDPESPSGVVASGKPRGHAMTDADIEGVLAAYGRAGADAGRLSFDGVEVHAGHGYLLDQFFWAKTNVRTDRWGGATLVERARFPLEAIKAVRANTPAELPLMIRISNWKSADINARNVETPAELEAWLTPFVDAGVDMFSVSAMRYDTPLFEGSPLSFAGWVKKVTGQPVMAAGGIGLSGDLMRTFGGETGHPEPVDEVARRVAAGEFDLVAVGRAMVSDPHWTAKIRAGRTRELLPCSQEDLAPSVAN